MAKDLAGNLALGTMVGGGILFLAEAFSQNQIDTLNYQNNPVITTPIPSFTTPGHGITSQYLQDNLITCYHNYESRTKLTAKRYLSTYSRK